MLHIKMLTQLKNPCHFQILSKFLLCHICVDASWMLNDIIHQVLQLLIGISLQILDLNLVSSAQVDGCTKQHWQLKHRTTCSHQLFILMLCSVGKAYITRLEKCNLLDITIFFLKFKLDNFIVKLIICVGRNGHEMYTKFHIPSMVYLYSSGKTSKFLEYFVFSCISVTKSFATRSWSKI